MERYFQITGQGFNIRCKLYCQEPRNIRKAVIFCHGFGGHKDNAAAKKFAEKLMGKEKYAAVITFDWPCHGEDVKKKLSLQDCDTYLDTVIRHVQENFTENLYAYATSFGGYMVLVHLLKHGSRFKRIALRSPAVNMFDALTGAIMTEENRENLRKGREAQVGFDRKVPVTAAFLEEVETNDIRKAEFLDWAEDILILHGTKDEIIPYGESAAFADNQLMEFIPLEGADHRCQNPLHMDLAIKHILEFFKQ